MVAVLEELNFMANDKKYKGKMIKLEKIFKRYTDSDNGLTLKQIADKLKEYDDSADRKTLYRDFDDLRAAGIEVESKRVGKSTVYYVEDDLFDLAELKILIDSVQASKFITPKKSKIIVNKLKTLTSENRAKGLTREVIIAPVKAENENVLYNVDHINEAIGKDRQISFQYYSYGVDKRRKPRHDGKIYHVSPWALIYNRDKYYLVAYSSDHQDNLVHYRVDRMDKVNVEEKEKRIGEEYFKKREIKNYLTKIFAMYSGETEEKVTFECVNRLADVVIDRFGKDPVFEIVDDEHFRFTTEIAISSQFYGWVAGIGADMKIVAPQSVVDGYKSYLDEILKTY